MSLKETETNKENRGTLTTGSMDLLNVAECLPDHPMKRDLIRMQGSNIVLVCIEA